MFLKSDGFLIYYLVNVVDDHLMEITDVIRVEEWISFIFKYLCFYEVFGWILLRFWYFLFFRNADKSKISKCKNLVSFDYYECIGILSEVMVNFLGNLGWFMSDDVEKFIVVEMVEVFDWKRMGLVGLVFDQFKFEWLNGFYICEWSFEELVQ